MVMKEDAPRASLMGMKQATLPGMLTHSETGNALEKQDGNPSEERKGRIAPAFSLELPAVIN
jgi:hypothetical protein